MKVIKLHLGCGPNVKIDYINIDKYVSEIFAQEFNVKDYNVLNLPFADHTVSEILAEHLVEHLSFSEESEFFQECFRLLVSGGSLKIEVPDIEWVFSSFLSAPDDFIDFYEVGSKEHYFGNGPLPTNRWGILTTHIYGNQNGLGQFHKNCYTKSKIEKISKLVGFRKVTIDVAFNKGTQVLKAHFIK